MTSHKPSDELLARQFHETYERLAPSYGYVTRIGTRTFEPDSDNGRLMIAVCAELRARLSSPSVPEGYVIAPKKPTQAMLDAGYWPCTQGRGAKSVWAEMIAAAQPPPAPPEAGDGLIQRLRSHLQPPGEWQIVSAARERDRILRARPQMSRDDYFDALGLAEQRLDAAIAAAPSSGDAGKVQDEEEECPGPDCPMCSGEACHKCGAGCWNSSITNCDHDCQERHEDPDISPQSAEPPAAQGEAGREGFYEKLWKDFCSLQRGDVQQIVRDVEYCRRNHPSPVAQGEALVSVPAKPTQAMLDAGYLACSQGRGAKSVWYEMVKAATAPSGGGL